MVLRQRIDPSSPAWMRHVLWAAALFNIYWGGKLLFRSEPVWPFGLFVLALGAGYVVAGFQPRRHWLTVFVGLLAGILGPIGWFFAETKAALPWTNGWAIFFYNVIWWVPFVLILRKAWQPRPPRQWEPRRRPGRRPGEGQGPRPDRPPRPGGEGEGPGSMSGPRPYGPYGPRRRRRRRGPPRDGDRRGGPPSRPSGPSGPSGPSSPPPA